MIGKNFAFWLTVPSTAWVLILSLQVKAAYPDDISSLLDQATQTCAEAEATAGQSFGCTNFGSLYSNMSSVNQMPSQMQEFESAVSTGMNLLGDLFGSGLESLQQQMGRSLHEDVLQAINEQNQRQHYDSYAMGQTGMGNLMGFIPKSTQKSDVPYHMSPYHSQINPLYEDPGPAASNDDGSRRPSEGQSPGSTSFFGLGGEPRAQMESDPQVVDLRNPAVPAAFDQPPFQGKGLVPKHPDSFDFDGTGHADNRVSFKNDGRDSSGPYSVSSMQADTLKASGGGLGAVKQAGDYIVNLFKDWNPSLNLNGLSQMGTEARTKILTDAITENMSNEQSVGRVKCNYYVSAIGKKLGIPYFWSYPDRVDQADQMHGFIQQAVGDPKRSGWRELTPQEAQKLANEGKFVIAVAKSKSGAKHGHVAIVAPESMPHDKKTDTSQWPWVMDNNHPNLSVRANWSFTSLRNTGSEKADTEKPIWAVWEPK